MADAPERLQERLTRIAALTADETRGWLDEVRPSEEPR
jgi:hypothetical protein